MNPQEFHLTVSPYHKNGAPSRLLANASELSRQQVKQAMHKGAVWITQGKQTRRLRRDKTKINPGDQLHLYFNPELLAQLPLEPRLIEDSGEFSVWFKPAGMLSQGSKWSDHTTLTRWVELHLQPQRPAFLIHRLDRAASGLMLIAHSKRMARQLALLFEQRKIEKHYRVVVQGELPEAASPQRIEEPLDGKTAISHAGRIAYAPSHNQTLLDVRIETGRKHQIRRHLSAMGHPVVGDRLYAETPSEHDLRLSAHSLAFDHPDSGESMSFVLPDDLAISEVNFVLKPN